MKLTKTKLKNIIKEEVDKYSWDLDPFDKENIPEEQFVADHITNATMKSVLDIAAEKYQFDQGKLQNLELDIEEDILDLALKIANKLTNDEFDLFPRP